VSRPILLLLLALLVGPSLALADEPLRGMTVSCFRWGPGEWDGPHMAPTLDRLAGLGVNAVALHPYGRIRGDGSVGYSPIQQDPTIRVPAPMLDARGMTFMIKPHLAYWGSPFSWRGEITFTSEADWRRFFDGYRDFIVHQARLAESVDAAWFVVGTELEKTTHRPEWLAIIAEVRAEYTGRLTYAANWDALDRVPFWDQLDAVGVQFYYPLTEPDTLGPTDTQLADGFNRRLDEALAIARQHGRPLLLTELGYPPHATAAARPWDDAGPDTAEGFALARRCLAVALREIDRRAADDLLGVFLWKWFPSPRDIQREFVLQYPQAEAVIADAWADE